MTDKKTEIKTEKIEREYIIPIRNKLRFVPNYNKANKAIKIIKAFIAVHMKVYDRDMNKIRLDKYLNELVWSRGIKNPPSKIKVKAVKEGDIVRVEILELPENLKFKKAREEKIERVGGENKKDIKKEEKKEEKSEEKKAEEEEKKSATVEAGEKMEKAAAKKSKHLVGGKTKEPKHQKRMALQK